MAPKKPPKGGTKKTYTWYLDPTTGMQCYECDNCSYQTVTKLWETTGLTDFHDAQLAQATKQINGIFDRLEKDNKDKERKLSFILVRDQHFLVWAKYGAIGEHDDEKTVVRELKLKMD